MAIQKKDKVKPPATIQLFPIVGIGASAGGLDAFKRLLKVIPEDSGMAYVLVQHLDPSHESILPDILSRTTRIPVHEITDDIHLAPNHIYIIPANKMLTSIDGVLKLAPRDLKKTKNLPIDLFFTSLAEVHTSFAVGVVLSGTGSDGTIGLKAIKAHRGITFAQDPQSAAYDGMPQSAVNAGVVDFILSPEEIPAQLLDINNAHSPTSNLTEQEEKSKVNDSAFKQILSIIRLSSGVDFTYYKLPTPHRRIARRMALNKTTTLSAYLKFIRNNRIEQDALFQDMLIPVTSFFRDPKTFQELIDFIIPMMLKNKSVDEPVRIWVAACSTGEEAYSLAICLHECCAEKSLNIRIQIFASDISEAAIKKARIGVYTKADVQSISESRLKNYFTKHNGDYEVGKTIRDMCVFAPHNFLKDPPFAKMDMITCRNVLIYMDPYLQKKALATFHYALKEKGFLVLGKSETTGASSDLFIPLARHEKIYSRRPVPGRFTHVATERKEESLVLKNIPSQRAGKTSRNEATQTDFRKSAEALLLSKYTPTGVVVNELLDIVHIHGIITPYLEPSPGKPNFNLIKMAREGLAFELRNAIHKAKTIQATVIKKGIPISNNGKQSLVSIEIVPLTGTVEAHYLILFSKTILPSVAEEKGKITPASQKVKKEAQLRIQQVENELAQSREDMRSITEDQEAANEELQSANEELLSSSEEMQSLNEELETSKEELQSTNEELTIVNHELLDKQEHLNASRMYAEAIIATLREPLVVLDRSLRIKTANAYFYKKFNVEETETEGKLLYEIQNRLWDDHLMRSMLENILLRKINLEDFEIKLKFPSMGERTLLLNARQIVNEKTAEQLILLAIEDVTERKATAQHIMNFNIELEAKIKERTADLEQTNSQLQQFAHAASHDLQEPLRKILTFTNLLQQKHGSEFTGDAENLMKKIVGSSDRMISLIKDLLEYSYLINHEISFERTDLNTILKNVLSDFELLIEQKKAIIKATRLPIINAVPLQMNQLFYNLISNSLKFAKENEPSVIRITSSVLSETQMTQYPLLSSSFKYSEIILEDNGIGFDQKYAAQIFTIFQRLHDKASYKGTGIGLALCKKIVENHNGEIFVKANEGKGATFHIILPFEKV
ncbi:MAG: CheR family methyltransferase [Chryseolinea sp.]